MMVLFLPSPRVDEDGDPTENLHLARSWGSPRKAEVGYTD